jgi:hypothetical protein
MLSSSATAAADPWFTSRDESNETVLHEPCKIYFGWWIEAVGVFAFPALIVHIMVTVVSEHLI